MPFPSVLPYQLVNKYRDPGIVTDAGTIQMNQYMSSNPSNGGNDNCASLLGNLRKMKDQGAGPALVDMVGGSRLDILIKGQGRPEDFATVWNFMCRNKDHLKKIKVDVRSRRTKSGKLGEIENSGNIFDLYFKGNSDMEAIQRMIKDRFFGIDCVGFVANYMIYAGLWDKYYGANPSQWDDWFFTEEVKKIEDIEPLNILLWNGHIAIVDWVWSMDGKTAKVDICQSSSGGPQCNEYVKITETNAKTYKNRKAFKLSEGTPKLPVDGNVYIMKRKGLDFYS
ncbi:MAG: hypothetical protein H6974_04390 [Gammaproteobacteria bacterium]|nr:hypothetical protein [Gammaproteobacteria bacterium]MCP5196021.1 hypothetical protein [Gammaproteobacteria bacterium]